MWSKNIKLSFCLPTEITSKKLRNNSLKSSTNPNNNKKCFRPMIEYNILNRNWPFSDKKQWRYTTNSIKKMFKSTFWNSKWKILKRKSLMPTTNCDNMSGKAWLLKWTDLILMKKSRIFPSNSNKKINSSKNSIKSLRKMQMIAKAQLNKILQVTDQRHLHTST